MKITRILLKLSGETLGTRDENFSLSVLDYLSQEISKIIKLGIEVGIVIGGGNLLRGAQFSQRKEFVRTTSDQMGMLATVMNSLAISQVLEAKGMETKLFNSFSMEGLAERFTARDAIGALKQKKIVLISGGTGNPYFSTDTAAVLRALEIQASCIIKSTKVDGIYDSDPMKNSQAKRFEQISFDEVIEKKLRVMDLTAFALCSENNLPIYVYRFDKTDALKNIVINKNEGTLVNGGNFG